MITENTEATPSAKTDCATSYTTVSIRVLRSKSEGGEAIREAIHWCVCVCDTLPSPSLGNRINFVSHILGGLHSTLLALLQEEPTK